MVGKPEMKNRVSLLLEGVQKRKCALLYGHRGSTRGQGEEGVSWLQEVNKRPTQEDTDAAGQWEKRHEQEEVNPLLDAVGIRPDHR